MPREVGSFISISSSFKNVATDGKHGTRVLSHFISLHTNQVLQSYLTKIRDVRSMTVDMPIPFPLQIIFSSIVWDK